MPSLDSRDNRRHFISTKNAFFIPKSSVWTADWENHNCDDSHHNIIYHGKMLLLGIWIICVFICSVRLEKGRVLYGARGLFSVVGLWAAILLAFVTVKTHLDIV